MPRPVSRAQAGLFGALAKRGVSWARDGLRGAKLKGLPARKGSGKKGKR